MTNTNLPEVNVTIADKFDMVIEAVTVIVSIFLAVGLFMLLPFFITKLIANFVVSRPLLNFIEGIVRLLIFLIYIIYLQYAS